MTSAALDRLALVILATALFVFTNERGFSHEIREGAWDIGIAFAPFLLLLLVAARTTLPSWTRAVAFAAAGVVLGLAALRMGGPLGALLVDGVIALTWWLAPRFGFPALPLLASVAADYALTRALAGPARPSPLPPVEAIVAVVVPALTLPLALADRERRLLRWGIWLTGAGMLSLLTERYYMRVWFVIAPDDVLLTVGGAALCAVACVIRTPRFARALASAGIAALVLTALLLLAGARYVSDSAVAIDEAARAVVQGHDPYVAVDVVGAVRARGLSEDLLTLYADGSGIERRYPYPAGSFLPSAALFALGADDVRYGFLGILALLYLLLIARAPAALSPYVAGIALVDVMTVRQVPLAGVEPSWALLLILAQVAPASGLFAGLAASARQTAWLYLPWLAVDRWREGWGALARWVALVAFCFAAVNAVFVWDAPAAWLGSVTAPIVAPYEALGFGLVLFFSDGPAPLVPRAAYTVATVLALGASLWTYWRHRASWRYGLAVLPIAPLYFAWRSLQNYFMFTPVFLIALIVDDPDIRRVHS